MRETFKLKMAVTSRGRTEIAGRVLSSFYDLLLGTGDSTLTLVVGSGDSKIGGIGIPMIVGDRKFDFGFCNPAGLGRMALLGRGFYKRNFHLRAIGVFPSWDRLVFAVHKDTGLNSLEDIKKQQFPLRVSTRYRGKYRSTVLAIEEVLKAYGFSLSDIEKWGGRMLRVSRPGAPERALHINEGQVDAVFDEGIKNWGARALRAGMKILPIGDSILKKLDRIGMPRAELAPEAFPELERSLTTVDFSGWLLFCHRGVPTRVTYAMAEAVDLEHTRIPVDHRDGRDMTMEEFCRGGEGGPLTLPLHTGAKRYYREKGYLA